MGFVHYNNTIEEQVKHVAKAKAHRPGMVVTPMVLSPSDTISKIDSVKDIKDFSTVCITDTGAMGGKLLGIVSPREIDFISDRLQTLSEVMDRDPVTAPPGTTAEQALELIKSKKIDDVCIVGPSGELLALATREWFRDGRRFPATGGPPSLSSDGRLLCGAAVGTREGDKERVAALVAAGVDAVILDSSQGDSTFQIDMLKYLKRNHPNLEVIGGNIVTTVQAKRLVEAGADALRVGMGSGSICTTQEVCAVGRGQAAAVYHSGRAAAQVGMGPDDPFISCLL